MTREPRRLFALLVVVGCLGAAAVLGLIGNDTSPGGSAPNARAAIPTVVERDAVSSSWYCAEGTGEPGGRADETILIANQGVDDARAVVTVMPGGQSDPVSRRVGVPRGAQVRVPVSSVAR